MTSKRLPAETKWFVLCVSKDLAGFQISCVFKSLMIDRWPRIENWTRLTCELMFDWSSRERHAEGGFARPPLIPSLAEWVYFLDPPSFQNWLAGGRSSSSCESSFWLTFPRTSIEHQLTGESRSIFNFASPWRRIHLHVYERLQQRQCSSRVPSFKWA